ncbi:CheR family methyltransferase [Alteromonas sp. 1_MG-2023]|uniref:CheR family methyltransferase n=1 Tax=Alteromonas sp. 1_MG-2023 TaxID=3062669 RepID=UPI0026E278FA|nr:CheR family methyltransferase [Alteromonas sp. 1_MG-2023]MDO6477451.1 CheR family methyltransferase [Alteromonas sp. 1_MG-2023]
MQSPSPEQRYFWVGIGASAGGLEPIQNLCEELPGDSNMIYIVAQHLSPKHDSKLTELVQRNTRLKVKTITNGMVAQPNVIHVTPPKYDVTVQGDKLFLSDKETNSLAKPSVNALFVSLAEAKKEHAVGVILSGTGTDGAHGIKMIRANGGITYAQDTKTAGYDGMPRSAIDTGCVDFCLGPSGIGKHLKDLSTKLPQELRVKIEADEVQDKFIDLVNIVRKQCGVSFKHYKKATLQRRIERRMLARKVDEFNDYVELLNHDSEEVRMLYKDILISVTNFFRDPATFSQLAPVLEDITSGKSSGEPVRLWVVGCATGEEAYSLAIMLSEALGGPDKISSEEHQIFASDVDTDALAVARRGLYSEASMADVPKEYKEKYFKKKGNAYEVIDELKRIILFSGHNIIDDPPFLRIDLITCRNLLIYFDQELQKKVYRIFHYALRERGHLFLGKSESTSQVTDIFRSVNSQDKIFQKRSVTSFNPQRFHLSGKSSVSIGELPQRVTDTSRPPSLPDALVEQLGDACVLINDNLDVEHIYGNSAHYIKFPKGKPSFNLSEIVIEMFRHEIRPLVYKVTRTKKQSESQLRRLTIDGEPCQVRMKVLPVQIEEQDEKFLLVCFTRTADVQKPASQEIHDESSERIKELEDELSMAREHIQTVVEELETSNEELQSMNEELQSSNEELQSSNEELETTNEELQSTNEELVTMNDQLNDKTTSLEQVTNQLVNIKNSLQFPLVCVDSDSNAVRANLAARKFFSLTTDLEHFAERLQERFESFDLHKAIKQVASTAGTQTIQAEYKDKHFWVHITPYYATNQAIEGAILSFIDNTELVHQQKELDLKREQAQKANLAKTEFLANVSHEIRTPLNAIVGVNEVFGLQIDNEEKRARLLKILDNATKKLRDLLNDLLDFAKLESGQLSLEYTEFSPKAIIRDLIDLYSMDNVNSDRKISAVFDKDLPDTFIGDPLRIQQIVTNLLSNAIKFTENGTIKIIAKGHWDKPVYQLVLQVSDTGIGMSEQHIKQIFDKFTQADSSIARRFGGSGLGLSIVKELVSLMAGSIDVESEEGKGTTFTINLPMQTPKVVREAVTNVPVSQLKLRNRGDHRILIIEDNEANIFILSSYLDELGVQYDVARNGTEGLNAVKDSTYALILLDLQMDEMDGFTFFEEFKKLPGDKLQNIRVVAVSAHVHQDIINRCKQAGMSDFLPKPVEIAKLHGLLEKYLDGKSS